jgi:molybdate transport system ATP-binding protein
MRLEIEATVRRSSGFTLDCRFDCEAGAMGIVGPSGSGKSTLLAAIAGIEPAQRVVIDGDAVTRTPVHQRRLGYVTQDASLFPHLSVRSNLLYPPHASDVETVAAALQIDHLLDRMPRKLSGGERRRVALARAICAKPRVLLLDEPFAGLDEALRRDAMSLLCHVQRTFDLPMILVSHRADEIVGLSDWAIRLENGSIAACGPSPTVLRGGETHVDNYFSGEVTGPGRLNVEGVDLAVAIPPGVRGEARAACFAHDIMVATRRPEQISARNVLPVAVVESTPIQDAVLLTISPPRLRVVVTPQAAAALELAPGREAFAIIKATSIAWLGLG